MEFRILAKAVPACAAQTLAALAGSLLLLGVFAESYWLFDLLTHFRWQYAAMLLGCGITLCAMKRWRSGPVWLVGGGALLLTLLSPSPKIVSTDSPTLKVVSFNVLKTNIARDRICSFLKAENADVVVLSEITTSWSEDLARLREFYPYMLSSSTKRLEDVVILSRHPFLATNVNGYRKRRWAEAVIAIDGTPFQITAAHTSPPTSAANSQARNRQLLAIGDRLAGQPRTILCGDLNVTPFSPWFGQLLNRSGLTDSSRGAGFSPTWMTILPLIAVQIDHVLLSPDLSLVNRRIGPALGSDHSPVIVELALTRASASLARQ